MKKTLLAALASVLLAAPLAEAMCGGHPHMPVRRLAAKEAVPPAKAPARGGSEETVAKESKVPLPGPLARGGTDEHSR